MSISRISSSYLADRGVFHLQNNLSLIAKLQNQIASGRRIEHPSDDPIGLTQLLHINLEASQNDQYTKNIEEGLSELNTTDTALTNIVNIAHRAREIAIQGANGINSPTQLDALSKEVDNLINQLVQAGNTSFAGRYVFSGFRTDTAPFTKAGAVITYNGTPAADPFERTVQISKNTAVAVNVHGENLLGSTAAASGLFFILSNLQTDLAAGNFANVRASIDQIKTEQDTVLGTQADLAGRANQLEMTKNRMEDLKILHAKEISKIQQVDMPEAISKLNTQQTVYQASIGVMAKIMQTTLLDFLQ